MYLTNDRAFAIKIGERYFVRHGKKGRVLTAWSLAGAHLFLPCTDEFDTAYRKLCQSGHCPRVVAIEEGETIACPTSTPSSSTPTS